MNAFDYAFNLLMKWEGGYVNDPHDPGGETKYGISKMSYPDLDIKNLTLEQAKAIYFDDFWIKARCHKMPPKWGIYHFINAVNIGVRRANRYLQRAVGVKPDGIIGPITLNAIKKTCMSHYAVTIVKFYTELAYRWPSKRRYLIGWLRRTIDAYHKAMAYQG